SEDCDFISFDDIGYGQELIPDGYRQLNWFGVHYLKNDDDYIYNGYAAALTSGKYIAYIAHIEDDQLQLPTINSINNITTFNARSFIAAAAWANDIQLSITGLNNNQILYEKTVTIEQLVPSIVELNWSNIDMITFNTSGGIPTNGYSLTRQVAFDNLCIVINPPEFKCPTTTSSGLYINSLDSETFWQCSNGIPYLQHCPSGLEWSQDKLTCDWKVPTTTIVTTTIVPPDCTLITFENIPSDDYSVSSWIPSTYHDLSWTNVYYLNVPYQEERHGWSGYSSALASGEYAVFNRGGESMTISKATTFNINSFVAAAVWAQNLKIDLTGSNNGLVVYNKTIVLQVTSATLVELNWSNIDTIHFEPYDGEAYSYFMYNTHFAIDDLCIKFH
ncbi:unnamed protein product, partial [Didymodactylos carnosus]